MVGTYRQKWDNGASTDFFVSVNLNRYHIDKLKIANLFTAASVFNFQEFAPRFRSVASITHTIGGFSVMARANIYGPYKAELDSAAAGYPIQQFKADAQFDLEVSKKLTKNVTASLGGRNIFDNYPQKDKIGAVTGGAIYRTDSVVDWQGGFLYAKLVANF